MSETVRVFQALRITPRKRIMASFSYDRFWMSIGLCESCEKAAAAHLRWLGDDGMEREALSCLKHLEGYLDEALADTSDVAELDVCAYAPRFLLNQIDI